MFPWAASSLTRALTRLSSQHSSWCLAHQHFFIWCTTHSYRQTQHAEPDNRGTTVPTGSWCARTEWTNFLFVRCAKSTRPASWKCEGANWGIGHHSTWLDYILLLYEVCNRLNNLFFCTRNHFSSDLQVRTYSLESHVSSLNSEVAVVSHYLEEMSGNVAELRLAQSNQEESLENLQQDTDELKSTALGLIFVPWMDVCIIEVLQFLLLCSQCSVGRFAGSGVQPWDWSCTGFFWFGRNKWNCCLCVSCAKNSRQTHWRCGK